MWLSKYLQNKNFFYYGTIHYRTLNNIWYKSLDHPTLSSGQYKQLIVIFPVHFILLTKIIERWIREKEFLEHLLSFLP